MDLFVQQTVNALALGGTYALLALGLAVVIVMKAAGLRGESLMHQWPERLCSLI